jgi:hypothetical protein
MPGLDPGIHSPVGRDLWGWIARSSPAMTKGIKRMRLCTSIRHRKYMIHRLTVIASPEGAWRSSFSGLR